MNSTIRRADRQGVRAELGFRAAAILAIMGLTSCQGPSQPQPSVPAPRINTVTQDSFGRSAQSLAEAELAIRLGTGKGLLPDSEGVYAVMAHLAEEGDPDAQFVVGEAYLTGQLVKRDPQLAVSWLQKAADRNYPRAQAELAIMYARGQNVPRDPDKGLALAKAGAAQGSPEAQNVLGIIHQQGLGPAADSAEAVKWFTKSASGKDALAMVALAQIYRDGKGVAADRVVAFAWFDLAVANTKLATIRDAAIQGRDEVALLLLPAEKTLAQRLFTEWRPGEDLVAKHAVLQTTQSEAPTAGQVADVVIAGAAEAPRVSQTKADQPITEKRYSFDVDLQPDGSSVRTFHIEIQPNSEAVLKDVGQMPLPFSPSLETVDVTEAYTLKPNGRRLPVDPAAIYAQLVPGSPNLPMFDDLHQKVVVFPYVEVGDLLVLTAKFTVKPAIPGLFSLSYWFDPTHLQEDVRISIHTPKSTPLMTETHDLRFERREAGDKVVYEWRYANLNPRTDIHAAVDLRDRVARLSASSFQSYEQLARAYAALAEPKMAVTPKISALAAEITAGRSDRRARAEAIYGWVSRHIRYVGIELGVGGLVPHDADTVLANGYGDCKDHAALFSALLKAAGIASDVVMINSGASFTLPKPPSIGTLNHAITYLPELDLYADTTAGVAPFGILPFDEYGKPVVHTEAAGKVVQRTPNLPADVASISEKTTAHLDRTGKIAGESETITTGPFSVWARQVASGIQAAGSEKVAEDQLRAAGLGGAGAYELTAPYELSSSYRIKSHFESGIRAEYLSGTSFFVPAALETGVSPGDVLLGPLTLVDPAGTEPTTCFSGRESQELSLELPDGKHLRELPKGREISDPHFHFKSEWSSVGKTVIVKRELSSNMSEPVCIGAIRQAAARAIQQIQDDYRTQIALVSD
ncbi:MAG TPA: DUF3857 domain-containing protein [Aliidongia sp.]|nr:DUF3857 domain-containing protein [Aliidongia sp.]